MEDSPLFISALAKGLCVLEAFNSSSPTMNLPEMAAACGISTSAAQRIAFTLQQLGYLRKDERSKRYGLTVRAMSLGYAYLMTEPLLQRAHPVLNELGQECGESVNLSVPDGKDMVFVTRIPSKKHIPVYMPIGKRIPAISSASGRAVLSCRASDEVERFIDSSPIERFTSRTTVDREQLLALVAEAAANGYAYAAEEYYLGDLNVAAAVVDHAGIPLAAVNVSVPTSRWTLEQVKKDLGPLVIRAARAIGQRAD
ncbi:MAG TPA: IclR family transcriptional regulator [Noviherbaspirillum sp.]|nr:IclR family transcriptional regulator [Noviherbaspirillum sp.]